MKNTAVLWIKIRFSRVLKFVELFAGKPKSLEQKSVPPSVSKEYLNTIRVREWQDIYHQIRLTVREMGLPINSQAAEYPQIHTALLSGLLSHIGMKEAEKQQYLGARNAHFAIFPNSVLFKKQPKWCMAAELVETSKLWGRMLARSIPNGLSHWHSI